MTRPVTREDVVGAVARGWCHPDTEHLVMDDKLALAIVDEVMAILPRDELTAERGSSGK
jgi:hypothetical protein